MGIKLTLGYILLMISEDQTESDSFRRQLKSNRQM